MTPDRFYNDMMKLATQSPRDAADVANTWRNRFLNMAGGTAGQKGAAVGVGTASGFTLGILGGRWKAEDDDIWLDWKNEGYRLAGLATWDAGSPYIEGKVLKLSDGSQRYPTMKPGTLWGVPITALTTLVFGGLSFAPIGDIGKMITASLAYSGIIYWFSQMGDTVGYDWKMKQISEAVAPQANRAA